MGAQLDSWQFRNAPRLNHAVSAMPGESLRGLIARACHNNFLPNSWGLLQVTGLLNRNVVNLAESPDIDAQKLAYAVGVSEADIEARRYQSLGNSHRSFFGIEISRNRICYRRRRFAPKRMIANPWHLSVWELRDLPFCPESWEMLQDTCPCEFEEPTKQRWPRTLSAVTECDRCGESLTRLSTHVVPPELRDGLALVGNLLAPALDRQTNPSALPPELRKVAPGRLFQAMIQLAKVAKGRAIAGLPERFSQDVTKLHAACVALLDWPNGLSADWLDIDQKPTSPGYVRQIYLELGLQPDASLVGLRELIRKKRSEQQQQEQQALQTQKGPEQAKQPIGLRPASEIAHLDPDTLLAAQREGLLSHAKRLHGEKLLPGFYRHEVIALGAQWNSRIEASTIAFDLGISLYGVEQMAALGILPANAPKLAHEGPHFTEEDIEEFKLRIDRGGVPISGKKSTLRSILWRINDRPKPWGSITEALLNGEIPYEIEGGSIRWMGEILIGMEHAAKIQGLTFERAGSAHAFFSSTMTQRDVCECLNLRKSDGQHLQFLPHSGEQPKRYIRDDVEAFRVQMIGSYEVARDMGIDVRKIEKTLRGHGVTPVSWKFYRREQIADALKIDLSSNTNQHSSLVLA
jgi:hypothetical protein